MSTAIRWSLFIVLIGLIAATMAQQLPRKRAIDDRPQLADSIISNDRHVRQSKRYKTTPRPPGFFGTIWKLIKDQVNDTKSAYGQLSDIFSNQFADERRPTTPAVITDNSTTTTEAPPQLTRAEFLDILRRNIIGLRRLYNLEWREAMKDSQKNIQDYKQEFHRKLYLQFKD